MGAAHHDSSFYRECPEGLPSCSILYYEGVIMPADEGYVVIDVSADEWSPINTHHLYVVV
jgi:hypothetical protein